MEVTVITSYSIHYTKLYDNLDDDHLQTEVIKQVGIGGEFLTRRETLKYTKSEYVPIWPPYGKGLMELIHAEASEILHTYTPPPLPEGAESRVEAILAEADQALAI